MKVSVIIPFYSNITWLQEAVDSVLSQTFSDYEIIVVNDGSPENDQLFLEKYRNKIVYQKTDNKGPAHARNFGIQIASGEYLAFLDSDDLWIKEKLEKQVALMDENNLVWSHTKYSVFNETDDKAQRVYHEVHNDDFKGNVYPKCLTKLNIGTPCVMVRTSVVRNDSQLRFSENMRFGQDGYFWILLGLNNELGYINESLTNVRRLGTNAVQRARVHLNVRGNMNKFLIKRMYILYPNVRISLIIKLTYTYCEVANNFINILFGTKNLKNKAGEFFSKIVYFPAYFIFKTIIK